MIMRKLSAFLCDGDQLSLDLFPGIPWDGRSPRGLTRVGSGLFLRPEPPGHGVMIERDPLQYDLWRPMVHSEAEALRPVGRGAPTLLPLKATRRVARRRFLEKGDYDGT